MADNNIDHLQKVLDEAYSFNHYLRVAIVLALIFSAVALTLVSPYPVITAVAVVAIIGWSWVGVAIYNSVRRK